MSELLKPGDAKGVKKNWQMPGNPCYQPEKLKCIFAYDELYSFIGQVEYAALEEVVEILISAGLAPKEIREKLNEQTAGILKGVVSSEVDRYEREVSKKDILAYVQIAQAQLPLELRPYLHILLTSYDTIDTANAYKFQKAYDKVIFPSLKKLVNDLIILAEEYKAQIQIGRIHGQHALPITIGFWLATIINRIIFCWKKLEESSLLLVGKISGTTGAYNAYVGLGLAKHKSPEDFEAAVLRRLGLRAAPISTQIVPPEPLAYFLFDVVLLSGALAQFANDCRHLMRTEIAEIQEECISGSVTSASAAFRQDPIVFKNILDAFKKNKSEFHKVFETIISEHQGDLSGSTLMRDFPTIIINLQTQIDSLLHENKDGRSLISRLKINTEKLEKNFSMQSDFFLAEPIYIALQLYGYAGDAYKLVNEVLIPKARGLGINLHEALMIEAGLDNGGLNDVVKRIPDEILRLFSVPKNYNGIAIAKTDKIIKIAKDFIGYDD